MVSTTVTAVATRVGLNPRELKRFIKFAVVGVIGAVVDFGSFNVLLHWLEPVVAGTISFVLAVISNFIWNRFWTYRDSRSKSIRRQFVQFVLVNMTGIVIRVPIVWYSERVFTSLVGQARPVAQYAERIGANMAVALAVGVVMFWNFFVNRYWTYNDVE